MKWELMLRKNGLQSGRNASLVGTSSIYNSAQEHNVIVIDQSDTDYWNNVFYISTSTYF